MKLHLVVKLSRGAAKPQGPVPHWQPFIRDKSHCVEAFEPKFDEAESFIDGLAIVTENKLKGIINRNGDYIIKPSFNDIRFISNNIIEVKRNIEDNFGIINKEGNYLLEPKYCSIFLYSDEEFFSYQEGKFNQRDMRCNGNFGLIDKSGKIKINPIFIDIGYFYDNHALIIVKYKNKQLYGYLRKPECL